MKKRTILFIMMAVLAIGITGCGKMKEKETDMGAGAQEITAEQAKEMMDQNKECIVLDVRDRSEYEEGHIAGAILIPYTEMKDQAEEKLSDKDQLILVYCRSGRRSAIAAADLVSMGYTNVKDFGGIIDWPYEVVKE